MSRAADPGARDENAVGVQNNLSRLDSSISLPLNPRYMREPLDMNDSGPRRSGTCRVLVVDSNEELARALCYAIDAEPDLVSTRILLLGQGSTLEGICLSRRHNAVGF